MILRVLGCHGSCSPGKYTTSFLIDERIAIDAGALCLTLPLEGQSQITDIVLSHCHHDHVSGLPALCDNRVFFECPQLQVHGLDETLDILRTHLFNGALWPDFTEIPGPDDPVVAFRSLDPMRGVSFDGVDLIPIPMDHTVPCVGFRIQTPKGIFLLGSDTRSLDALLEEAKAAHEGSRRLLGVVAEVSFPNRWTALAESTGHLSPEMIAPSLEKLPPGCPVFITHIKPDHEKKVLEELGQLGHPTLEVLREGMEIDL